MIEDDARPTFGYAAPLPGMTVPAQLERLREWRRLDVEHHDQEVTAGPRPGLVKTLDLARKQRDSAPVVVVADMAVIAPDVPGQQAFAARLELAGATLVPLVEPDESEWRALLDDYENARRLWDRKARGAAMRAGWETKIANATPTTFLGGKPALGLAVDAVTRELVEEARGQAIVEAVKTYRRARLNMAEIAAMMTADGYKTSEGKGRWHREQVARILRRYGDPLGRCAPRVGAAQ